MHSDEQVIGGVLCYYLRDEYVPYSSQQLTTFLVKAEKEIDRLIKQQLGEGND